MHVEGDDWLLKKIIKKSTDRLNSLADIEVDLVEDSDVVLA